MKVIKLKPTNAMASHAKNNLKHKSCLYHCQNVQEQQGLQMREVINVRSLLLPYHLINIELNSQE